MSIIKRLLQFLPFIMFVACSGSTQPVEQKKSILDEEPVYNSEIGIGPYVSIELSPKLDTALVSRGTELYVEKCAVCHKLNKEVLTGPGWEGVTSRHTSVWIMNYLTNTNEMLDTDPELIEMIAKYKSRMINYNLNGEDARALLEYMRMNDSIQSIN